MPLRIVSEMGPNIDGVQQGSYRTPLNPVLSFLEHPVVKVDPDFVPAPEDDPEVLRSIDEALRARRKAGEAEEAKD